MSFKEQRIKTWNEILSFPKSKKGKWVFRGQNDESWGLTTSFERTCNHWGIAFDKRPDMEERLKREFQRKLHHYTEHIPEEKANIEWLAVMQHYGAPTRLLDFSYSIYMAAYFAIEKAIESVDSVIWAINAKWAVRESAENCPDHYDRLFIDPISPMGEQFFREILSSKPFSQFAWNAPRKLYHLK